MVGGRDGGERVSQRLRPPADTVAHQRRASDPAASAWVSANAGSGKTHVLAQRVVRILLGGAPPSRLLCLTFTRAAAANMAERVHSTLARWTLLDDPALASAIVDAGAPPPAAQDLVFARRLFARVIETPGGLKILTIHAFCERLLHLFPFEANVAAGFEVAEEPRRKQLLERALNGALEEAARGQGAPASALRLLSGEIAQSKFEAVLREALKRREDLEAQTRDPGHDRLRELLGLAAGDTPETVRADMLERGIGPQRWPALIALLRDGAVSNHKGAAKIELTHAAYVAGAFDRALEHYLDFFFTQKGDARKSFMTVDLAAKHPKVPRALRAEAERLARLLEKRRAVRVFALSRAVLTLAHAVWVRYERMKAERSLLDFDDLIARTRNLVNRSDAAWVLYKLDQGVDHILVDEAQDTSPAQWEILETIAREFTSGRGARPQSRTFFAVGDEKQSIFSFQGAAPHMFAQQRRSFARAVAAAGQRFEAVALTRSFRSAPEILAAVDKVFAHRDNAEGLSADDAAPPAHEAVRVGLQGMVQFWDVFRPIETRDPTSWRMPLDNRDPADPASRLASAMAQAVAEMVARGSPQRVMGADGPRPVRPGDVMVLVRARNAVFGAAIKALKDRGVAVAGADRLALTGHLAVMDLMALGRALLLPQDDLTFATVLKGPLVGLDDDDLIELAPEREGSLWRALELSAAPRHRDAAARLRDWRLLAQRLTPFGFYSHVLGAQGGRRAILARLGLEATDALDEFLALALDHERFEAPSLATFLGALEKAGPEIKRDMESAGDAVRVMTVHAAKGLEARIVFLPDTCAKPGGKHDPELFRLGGEDGALAWSPRAADDPALVAAAREEARRLATQEHRRLLYVAMTRAEERLYIAGFCGKNGPAEGCWHEMTRGAFADHELVEADAPWGEGAKTWTLGAPLRASAAVETEHEAARASLPEWLLRAAPDESPPAPPIQPSRALAAADQWEPREGARARGRVTHALLQSLPGVAPARRLEAALAFARARGFGATLAREALSLIERPELAQLFGPDSRAEVALSGAIFGAGGREIAVSGQVDRLAVGDAEVWLADFKTGRARAAADTPIAYVVQLALYRALLAQIYPDRPVRAAIVWTREARAVELPAAQMDAAVTLVKLT